MDVAYADVCIRLLTGIQLHEDTRGGIGFRKCCSGFHEFGVFFRWCSSFRRPYHIGAGPFHRFIDSWQAAIFSTAGRKPLDGLDSHEVPRSS